MTDQAIRPLRRPMIEDMSMRKFTLGTRNTPMLVSSGSSSLCSAADGNV
jgi:hypothetical protein